MSSEISKYRLLELSHFCFQYNEWKNKLKFGDKSKILERKCKLVEQTAIEADPELYKYILVGVTNEKASYSYLKALLNIPCSKNTYYNRRKKFFKLLDLKKESI